MAPLFQLEVQCELIALLKTFSMPQEWETQHGPKDEFSEPKMAALCSLQMSVIEYPKQPGSCLGSTEELTLDSTLFPSLWDLFLV